MMRSNGSLGDSDNVYNNIIIDMSRPGIYNPQGTHPRYLLLFSGKSAMKWADGEGIILCPTEMLQDVMPS